MFVYSSHLNKTLSHSKTNPSNSICSLIYSSMSYKQSGDVALYVNYKFNNNKIENIQIITVEFVTPKS